MLTGTLAQDEAKQRCVGELQSRASPHLPTELCRPRGLSQAQADRDSQSGERGPGGQVTGMHEGAAAPAGGPGGRSRLGGQTGKWGVTLA